LFEDAQNGQELNANGHENGQEPWMDKKANVKRLGTFKSEPSNALERIVVGDAYKRNNTCNHILFYFFPNRLLSPLLALLV